MAEPVLLIGIPSEPPLEMVAAALDRLGLPYLLLNQREVGRIHACVAVDRGTVSGVVQTAGTTVELEIFGGVYSRVMDHQLLPEIEPLLPEDALRRHADRVHEALSVWCELTPARVVNRLSAQGSNASKPYQAQLIAQHFAVPETLITSDPNEVIAFREAHGRLVYKSISGARSIVKELRDEDLARLDRLRWCPAQFQQRIPGLDMRVHTLADGQVFATAIHSGADDWRYSNREAQQAELREHTLDAELSARCLALAASLGLDFAGIDLRITPDGKAYCFEVNPSPAYSAFEAATAQPIALALASYLAGFDESR
jgi:hypothetical protein